MKVRARAPLRISLAGGGTDVSPYCDQYTGVVLNTTIDRYAYTTIEKNDNNETIFIASDLNKSTVFNDSGILPLHQATYQYMLSRFNLDQSPITITTYCDSPVGSGLGTSSALVVSMLTAYAFYFDVYFETLDIAWAAFHIERELCGFNGGRQDQFSATYGGINCFQFSAGHDVTVEAVAIAKQTLLELESSLLMVYTGVSRESSNIIQDQTNNIISKNDDTIDALHSIRDEAFIMTKYIESGNFDGIIHSMKTGWVKKKQLCNSIVTTHIENIYNTAIEAGASAGKISGAGGGGFMLFFVKPERRHQVMVAIQPMVESISNCHFTTTGAIAWKV